ncbi:MAG TPA: VIT1/CCC1 transporter family protein [Dehalococcoidia bacterium]|jgi:VIT1/CCC1 family predicted Fe2+/Mn2+ transporter|nr:VIT1/CCC1 transporter family protein [Dehalococcoidia bacterium]
MTTRQTPAAPQDEATKEEVRRLERNLRGEIDGAALYRLLASAEPDPARARVFEELAQVEDRHAAVWREKLRELGVEAAPAGPSVRVRAIGWLARRFGVDAVLPIVRTMEATGYQDYMAQDATAQALAPDERKHARTLATLSRTAPAPPEEIAAREPWHRRGTSGTLRATVFGVSDGLVSNTSLVMGFAGAQTEGKFVLLAGLAGLLAGAFSMAAGEYVSMRAQRELFERQIEIERDELAMAPEEERRELALIYRAKGVPKEEAEAMAERLMASPESALDTMVREELGLDPGELGSPWGAAIGSFVAFALGALVPVIPFFFGANASLPFVIASGVLSAIAVFGVGAALSLFTGRNALVSGARQLGIAAAAAVLTFGVGRIIGVSTGV